MHIKGFNSNKNKKDSYKIHYKINSCENFLFMLSLLNKNKK